MAKSTIDKTELYKQYRFYRLQGDSFSVAVWKLSIHHGKHEQAIIRFLTEEEEK